MLPTEGLIDQVTAGLDVFETVAANVWVCDGVNVMLPGLNATATVGVVMAIVVEADLVESWVETAVIVALPEEGAIAGAV
jgi:hypothetical protein